MILEFLNISFSYGKAQVLHDVSLNVNEGEIVSLLGANGAGKSTVLLLISGIIRAERGRILFKNMDISREKANNIVKRGIAQCPEGKELFLGMTVEDNLKLGAFLRKGKSGILEDLNDVYRHFPRLLERRKQIAGSLSGGEQQMLAIGRALMSRPTLLMLDEPSLGLSPILIEEVFRIIGEINREGTAVLLVEQNIVTALEISQRGYVLETGKIFYSGSSKDLKGNESVKRAYLGGK
jgi:branched-chain amino acid transport system ATP-binding protein